MVFLEAMFKQGYIRKECKYNSVNDIKDGANGLKLNPLKKKKYIRGTTVKAIVSCYVSIIKSLKEV